jgi:hypothetical protein
MMPTKEMKLMAEEEKVCDCGYLFPKDLLLQGSDSKKKNYAVVNSLGGYQNAYPACKTAIDTADFINFRDRAPFVPDSAVMINHLYRDHIETTAQEVLKELQLQLFPNDGEGKHAAGTKFKYIAVQHKQKGMRQDRAVLARVLDQVSNETKCTVVFFAAGTAEPRFLCRISQTGIAHEAAHHRLRDRKRLEGRGSHIPSGGGAQYESARAHHGICIFQAACDVVYGK